MRGRMLAVLGLVALAGVSGSAEGSLYMKLAGVDGEVVAQGYAKTTEIDSYSLSITRDVAPPTGSTKDRDASKPAISDLAVSAAASNATVPILRNLLGGPGFDSLHLYLTRTGGKSEQTYAEWDFKDVVVTSYATAGGADGKPAEAYKFNFTQFQYVWHNFDSTGREVGTAEVSYDLARAQSDLMFTLSGDTSGFTFLTAVPEPTSAAVLALGAVVPVLGRRRRTA